MSQYVVFKLDEQAYCLALSCVERVIQTAAISALPKAPEIVLGILNFSGAVIPALDIRRRFNLPEKAVSTGDQFIIARTARRKVAVLVDSVTGVIEVPVGNVTAVEEITRGTEYIAGVIRLPDGMALIHDLDTFLSLEEERVLDSAISDFKE
jgi:purine-binding chemotaxis protein CheW